MHSDRHYRKGGAMNVRGMKIMGCLLILICASGCATMSDVVRAKAQGKGTSRVYRVNADRAWEISKMVFRFVQAEAVEEHRSEGYMLARIGKSSVSWGAVMGVWIEPVDDDSTRVTVVIKRINPAELLVLLKETDFHDDFELASRRNL
jgi:hypothetical protein